jgi:rhodanese-related sulfurtransferase
MPTNATEVRRWSPDDLKSRLDAGEPITLLDVREEEERKICALPAPETADDLHVPIGSVPDHVEALRRLLEDRGRPLVIYCHHGVRSLATARWLADRGFGDVINLDGGIDAWSLTVDPKVPRY